MSYYNDLLRIPKWKIAFYHNYSYTLIHCWNFKTEEKDLQPRILYPDKLSFTKKGKIKTVSNKQIRRLFFANGYTLQEILKQVLQVKMKEGLSLIQIFTKKKEY